jgi:hypothetical protein
MGTNVSINGVVLEVVSVDILPACMLSIDIVGTSTCNNPRIHSRRRKS